MKNAITIQKALSTSIIVHHPTIYLQSLLLKLHIISCQSKTELELSEFLLYDQFISLCNETNSQKEHYFRVRLVLDGAISPLLIGGNQKSEIKNQISGLQKS